MSEKTGGHISAKFWNFSRHWSWFAKLRPKPWGWSRCEDSFVKWTEMNRNTTVEKVAQKPAANVKLNAKCDKGLQFQSATPTVWFRDLSLLPLQKMCFFVENADKDLWTMCSGIKCEKERARVHSLEKQDIYMNTSIDILTVRIFSYGFVLKIVYIPNDSHLKTG